MIIYNECDPHKTKIQNTKYCDNDAYNITLEVNFECKKLPSYADLAVLNINRDKVKLCNFRISGMKFSNGDVLSNIKNNCQTSGIQVNKT